VAAALATVDAVAESGRLGKKNGVVRGGGSAFFVPTPLLKIFIRILLV
jgi:hypothetical protein